MAHHSPSIGNSDNQVRNGRGGFLLRIIKAAGIAILAFALSFVFAQPLSFSAGTLLSSHDSKDFNMSDFYNIVADSRPVRAYEERIVIVNIDRTTRDDVTDVIEMLSVMNPVAVGLDVTFNEPHEDDSRLLAAIDDCPNLVMAVGVGPMPGSKDTFMVDDYSFFYPSHCDDYMPGVVNLPSKFDGGTIREFPVYFTDPLGRKLPSMAMALAEIADPDAANVLKSRGNKTEMIDFPSRTFNVIDWNELPDSPDEIDGRIVLVGAMNEINDLHRTPISEQMSGVMIHAYAISTILRGNYYHVAAEWINLSLAFLLCFLLALSHLSLKVQIKGLALRVVQVLVLYMIIRSGYYMFVDRHLIMDFSFSLLMLTFGLFACDVWIGTSYIIGRGILLFKKKSHITND